MLTDKSLRKKQTIVVGAICLVVLALALIVDFTLPSYHIIVKVIKKGAVYALVAVSMNLLNGFTGLFSLGQAGFMLLGAYTYAILSIPVAKRAGVYQYYDGGIVKFSIPEALGGVLGETAGNAIGMIICLILGGIVAGIFAYLIGLPVLRLKSDYLAIATLGFAEIVRTIFQWTKLGPLTNGSNLLKGYPDFKHCTPYILIVGVVVTIMFLLVNSTYGRAFKAIRDDEVAAEAMGINLSHHKRLSFVISSFFAGIGGGMLAMYMGTVQALSFKSSMTYEILLLVVIGGIGSISGSVVTSFVYVAAVEWLLRGLDSGKFLGISAPGLFKNGFRMAIVSVLIMVVVLFFTKGIFGDKEIHDLVKDFGKKSKKGKEGASNG